VPESDGDAVSGPSDTTITYRDFKHAVWVATFVATLFGVSIALEVVYISKNYASAKHDRALGCTINSDLLQSIKERLIVEGDTTFPAIEGDIKERRIEQLKKSQQRLEEAHKACLAVASTEPEVAAATVVDP
jgi:hypothetical protein